LLTIRYPNGMKKNIYRIFFLLIIGTLASCVDNSREAVINRLKNKQIHDSMMATGQHGYYASYFIRGKIKTMQLFHHLPFTVKIFKLDASLVENEIVVNINDGTSFNLKYIKDGQGKKVHCNFNDTVKDGNLRILISKSLSVKDHVYKMMLGTDYLFVGHSY
jgi:hypothetical protein